MELKRWQKIVYWLMALGVPLFIIVVSILNVIFN